MAATTIAANKPRLTGLTLWIMTVTTCLVVANIYYNQPLLGDIARTFKVSSGTAQLVSMITQLGYAAGILLIAPLADIYKRKRLILYSFAVSIAALLAVALSPTIYLLIFASFLAGASSLIPQLLIPMAAHLAKPDERGKKIGIVMSGLLIGILLSRMISGTIGEYFGWRAMFYIAAGVMVITGLIVFLFLPEIEPDYNDSYKNLMLSLAGLFKAEPKLRFAALRGALCFACFMAFWTTLGFLLHSNFNYGSKVTGYFGLVGIVGALAAGLMGRLSDKMNAFNLSFFTLVLILISFILFIFSGHSVIGLIAGVIILDMGVQATHISNQAIIFALGEKARNRINTIYIVSYFIGGAAGTLIVSVLWNHYQWTGVCVSGMALSSIAIIVHLLNRNSMQNKPTTV